MGRRRKPLGETCGKDKLCLKCLYCKTRVFRSFEELEDFCAREGIPMRKAWKKKLAEGEVSLYWCAKGYGGPRLFRVYGSPFQPNCTNFKEI